MSKIMGPNPIKLEEELLSQCKIPKGAVVCDLGSGQGLTSVFLAKEYGFQVYAADLWSDPKENRAFFKEQRSYRLRKNFLTGSYQQIPITISDVILNIWMKNCSRL